MQGVRGPTQKESVEPQLDRGKRIAQSTIVFRVFEISYCILGVASNELSFEVQHLPYFGDSWRNCCITQTSFGNCIQLYENQSDLNH